MPYNMFRRGLLFVFILALCSGTLYSGTKPLYYYRKIVRNFIKQKKYNEALEVYKKASEEAGDNIDQALFMKHAAKIAFSYFKDFKKAINLAKSIKDKNRSQSVQLVLMVDNKLYNDAIENFKDADISKWPFEYRLESYYARGRAYFNLKNYKKAEPDLLNAVESIGQVTHRGNSCLMLGKIYLEEFKNEKKALDIFDRALKISGGNYAWRNNCFINKIDLLLKQGKFDDAANAFDAIDFSKVSDDYWRVSFYLLRGKVLMLQGNNGQAATILTKVLRTGGISDYQKQRAQEMIDSIIGSMNKE